MKIVFFGSAQFGIPSLEALAASNHQLLHIFTQPSHPAGRGRLPRPTPVAEWACKNGIACTEAENINDAEMAGKIAGFGAELLVVIAFGQKISSSVINLFPKGAINVHASLLPKYRGAAPINRTIINDDSTTGITIITLADKMDAGFMLAKAAVPIEPFDDAGSLHDKLALASPALLMETIVRIAAGTAVFTPQDPSEVTYAHKLKKSDGYIDFSRPGRCINNLIRGLWPWPGACANYVSAGTGKCSHVIIASAEIVPAAGPSGRYGILDENLNVICGQDALKILRLKPAGSALMDFADFANGRATAPGDLFMKIDA